MCRVFWGLITVLMVSALALAQQSHSPYAGQEKRAVKTLSPDEEIQALLNGRGMGLAKVAELNHYPGLRWTTSLCWQI
jgi:hypothetical protein